MQKKKQVSWDEEKKKDAVIQVSLFEELLHTPINITLDQLLNLVPIFKQKVIISRMLGFAAVITGIVLYFAFEDLITLVVFIIIVSVGGTFTLFAHFIYHPKRLWKFLVSIPKTIYKVMVTVWLLIKSSSIYIYRNGIRILLLIVMVFTFIYGIIVATTIDFELAFFGIFNSVDNAIRISLGSGFMVVAIVAFILLRRELKKLRTGMSKDVIKEIRRRWRDE